MDADGPTTLDEVIADAQVRAAQQVAALESALDAIIAAAELTSTDDEHDPEGATIAYERAQVTALLRQARDDCAHLDRNAERVARDGEVRCRECGRPIPLERIVALPTTQRCVSCASSSRR